MVYSPLTIKMIKDLFSHNLGKGATVPYSLQPKNYHKHRRLEATKSLPYRRCYGSLVSLHFCIPAVSLIYEGNTGVFFTGKAILSLYVYTPCAEP